MNNPNPPAVPNPQETPEGYKKGDLVLVAPNALDWDQSSPAIVTDVYRSRSGIGFLRAGDLTFDRAHNIRVELVQRGEQ